MNNQIPPDVLALIRAEQERQLAAEQAAADEEAERRAKVLDQWTIFEKRLNFPPFVENIEWHTSKTFPPTHWEEGRCYAPGITAPICFRGYPDGTVKYYTTQYASGNFIRGQECNFNEALFSAYQAHEEKLIEEALAENEEAEAAEAKITKLPELETCANCHFWIAEDSEDSVGECRRYSPKSSDEEILTSASYWCGEYLPA